MNQNELMSKIVSLCKRRGFVFQSSEIYGGLKSAYDYGPLGVELKRNIANKWWQDMVTTRENIVGIDASIMMHPQVWKTSGHLAGFADPLVDCMDCKERFRADKAPKVSKAVPVVQGNPDYVCPKCGSQNLSDERQFNLMFRSAFGAIDPFEKFYQQLSESLEKCSSLSKNEIRQKYEECMGESAVYLRPETAQAMFVQFLNVQQTQSMKVPFGIAQVGKSFRNEIITEHFIFRSCEFEQMEMEFFCEPGTQLKWLEYWKSQRLNWYKSIANNGDKFRLREHDKDELAHYSDACFDVEYEYPWGWDELEGVASRTDYDLKKHAQASGAKLSYFDPNKEDPETGKKGWRYTPYVIEPAAGLTRSVLCFLADAYFEETIPDSKGNPRQRTILKLHSSIAPYQVAAFPLLRKEGHPELAGKIAADLREQGLKVSYDESGSIGKRYAKHDEIGTPYCLTVDSDTIENKTITVRDRDSGQQEKISLEQISCFLKDKLEKTSTL